MLKEFREDLVFLISTLFHFREFFFLWIVQTVAIGRFHKDQMHTEVNEKRRRASGCFDPFQLKMFILDRSISPEIGIADSGHAT